MTAFHAHDLIGLLRTLDTVTHEIDVAALSDDELADLRRIVNDLTGLFGPPQRLPEQSNAATLSLAIPCARCSLFVHVAFDGIDPTELSTEPSWHQTSNGYVAMSSVPNQDQTIALTVPLCADCQSSDPKTAKGRQSLSNMLFFLAHRPLDSDATN